ncbi:PREDICTED: F-box/kelch-repeat protein At1g57790-like [Nicotiana attenuata]|uniref:F-box/kelch-repeat protein At1g57790-like n=1 Tax=Nicotiana attenuata TaxID=49451 RepID=UPI000904D9AC|nr:PREDICTED: F-box/kelch-repeat protein At1g57790-like [Nicotiana attenuata]
MDTKLRSRDWSGLSDLLLDSIFQKLFSISDCLRFGAVCKSWFSFLSNNYDTLQQLINSSSIDELPLLMIFTNRDSSTIYTSLYNVTKDKIILDLELPLPDYTRKSCGSYNGWLAFQTVDCSNIILFNPFSDESIHLPSPSFQVAKFSLSKNPSTNPFNFEIAAMCMGYSDFAILKPGSKSWSYTHHRLPTLCDLI